MSQFLTTKSNISLAYHQIAGKTPGVIFFGGFMSDMTGTKALILENFCRERGQAFIRFDYRGHGQSSGKFVDGNISLWTQDALTIFDSLTEGPQILVGSSMGGWIATLVARERAERVAALIGIAAAPDFTEDLMWQSFTPEDQSKLLQNGVIYEPSDYGYEPSPITLNLIEDGRNNLLLRAPISFTKPVRLLHGMQIKMCHGNAVCNWQKNYDRMMCVRF